MGETFVDTADMHCYLCGSTKIKRSRERRPVEFNIIRFFYKCAECKAYSLWTKLEKWEIQNLYSANYIGDVKPASHLDFESDKARFAKLESFLRSVSDRTKKRYLDFGCGASADTVLMAQALGFQAYGVEVAEDTRKQATLISGCEIFSPEDIVNGSLEFDIVFLGDVLEHVINPISLVQSVQKSLTPGGVLVIQGPLEGAPTLSNFFVSLKSHMFFQRPSTFPPYHVSLARKNSILRLLEKRSLKVIEMLISEPCWPAPQLGSRESFASPSKFLLSLTKLVDIGINKIHNTYGTRFFLIAKNQ